MKVCQEEIGGSEGIVDIQNERFTPLKSLKVLFSGGKAR